MQNWPAYEAALRQRGDVMVWFDEDAIDAWSARPRGHPGGQQRTSDLAIIPTLTLRTVFHLALRQAEGFVASLIRVMALDLEAPDHTTLSRRCASVTVPPPVPIHAGPIHLVIDSTGLKIVGDGEWHVIKHKPANKRRCWRKPHLGVDADGFIVASELTASGVDDGSVGGRDHPGAAGGHRAVHRRWCLRYPGDLRGPGGGRRSRRERGPPPEEGRHPVRVARRGPRAA